jgi:hypothetical protein
VLRRFCVAVIAPCWARSSNRERRH